MHRQNSVWYEIMDEVRFFIWRHMFMVGVPLKPYFLMTM